MKTSARSALWAVLALSPFAYLACSDDSSGASTITIPTPGIDASSTTPVADAAPATTTEDSGTDAGTDAGSTLVTVTVANPLRHPVANVSVVFYDANSVATTVMTDATGKAAKDLPTGGTVTAVFGSTTSPRLYTILGVKAGDQLSVLDDAPLVTDSTQFAITRPATDPVGTASIRLVLGTCSATVPTANPSTLGAGFDDSCWNQVSTVAPPLYLAASNANGAPIAITFITDYTLVDVGTTSVTFPAWQTLGSQTDSITVANAPTAGTIASRYYAGVYHNYGAGTSMERITNGSWSSPNAAPALSTFRAPGATFQQDEAVFYEETDNPFALVTRTVAVRQAPTATASVDVGTLLPAITGTTLTVANGVPSIAITSQSALTATKAIFVQSMWFSNASNGQWTVLSPPSATTVTPPALPTALAAYAPSTSIGDYRTPALAGAADATSLPSYDAARAAAALFTVPLDLSRGYFTESVSPPLPVDGTLKLTAYGYNDD